MEELDLKELFNIFWNRKIYIILITIMFMLIGIVYTLTMVTPKYTATTKLILVKVETTSGTNSGSDSITSADLTMNQKLLSTYKKLIKEQIVLKPVKQNLGIDVNERDISIKSEEDSEILVISVSNENPEYSALIANELAKVFPEKAADIFNINNVSVLTTAEVPTAPSNVNHPKDIMIFTFIGLVVAIGYALLANMLDTTIKTPEDIDKCTKLTVLAEIPLYESDVPVKKGGRK